MKEAWGYAPPKTLFFDIDETMIHCIDDKDPPTMKGKINLKVNCEGVIDIDVNERPGLRECLANLK